MAAFCRDIIGGDKLDKVGWRGEGGEVERTGEGNLRPGKEEWESKQREVKQRGGIKGGGRGHEYFVKLKSEKVLL